MLSLGGVASSDRRFPEGRPRHLPTLRDLRQNCKAGNCDRRRRDGRGRKRARTPVVTGVVRKRMRVG